MRATLLHALFFIRMDLYLFKLNILRIFPISASKYSKYYLLFKIYFIIFSLQPKYFYFYFWTLK